MAFLSRSTKEKAGLREKAGEGSVPNHRRRARRTNVTFASPPTAELASSETSARLEVLLPYGDLCKTWQRFPYVHVT